MNSSPRAAHSLALRIQASRGTRSATLIVVLGLLVLLLVLIVGFLSAVTRMSSSSQHYASGSSALALSESAVSIVTSQIRLATAGEPTVTWTSQPGLLRTFDNTGAAQQIYKLYSAPGLYEPASSYNESDDTPPANWSSSPALYVDLNQPSFDSSGYLVYPIADPRATNSVTGFSIGTAPGYSGGVAAPNNNPVPMPVTWLYVLADGGIAVPSSVNANGEVAFNPQPTSANPVVGRIAFWTDDDTCKVNINTASYSVNNLTNSSPYMTYWGSPVRISQQEELYLSRDQPWKGEYQRYPGHPATTALNLILPELSMQQIFALTPRYNMGGSLGGTVAALGAANLPPKGDRLYASVDELFYSTNYNSGTGRGTNNLTPLTLHDLDARRFFLTAQSRAPEVNLFGQPRVTIWPIWDVPANRSTLDKTIAFCSTIGTNRFYFTRDDPNSQTTDIGLSDALGANTDIYAYLQRNTGRAIPGFGGNFLTKYASDRDQILTDIFDTIRISNLAENGTAVPYTSNTNSAQVMGQVLPTINPNGTRGAGRMDCITEASLVFVNSESYATNVAPGATNQSNLLMGLLYKFYQPAAGAVAGGANFYYKSSKLNSFTVNADAGTNVVLFPTSLGLDTYYHTNFEYNYTAIYGGATVLPTCASDTIRSKPSDPALPGSNQTFGIPPVSIPFRVTGKTFTFNGGTNIVDIYFPNNPSYIQEYTFVFPPINAASLNVPTYFTTSSSGGNQIPGPWSNSTGPFVNSLGGPATPVAGRFSAAGLPWIGPTEVVRSLQLANGDVRAVAHMKDVPATMFATTPNYNSGVTAEHGLESYGNALGNSSSVATFGTLINGLVYGGSSGFNLGSSLQDVPIGINGVVNSSGQEGDWDNGFATGTDGAYLPKSDEGVSYPVGASGDSELWGYFVKNNNVSKLMYLGLSPTLFSANRQVPSAVMFGDIPTGIQQNLPWQTLLFRPARSYHMGGTSHPGAASPPDYLLLDLFQMPVVEPYAISEPFSTAGKANMNYRIKPFSSYITRDTAVRSVLGSTLVTAIPRAAVYGWRVDRTSTWLQPMYSSGTGVDTRWPVDAGQTLSYFESRFNSTSGTPPPVFVSESEICNIDLIPQGGWTTNTISSFWDTTLTDNASMRYTGDNSLEKPYASIYSRLTTRSNTYTIHVYSEALNPSPSSSGGWNESTGHIAGQWRGEYCLERYIDPNDPSIPPFLQSSSQNANLNSNYIFHTLYTKRFAP